jgi:hypothetical protein
MDHKNALPIGYVIEGYEIVSILGHGGFGITYKATDLNLGSFVAIKEYLPQELAIREHGQTVVAKSSHDEESYRWGLDRFIDEARTLARFKHANIVRVLRYLEANNTGYLVMDFEEGQPLSEFLNQRDTPLDEEELCAIFLPIMDGLREVHALGLLHRDIKPGNIYLRHEGPPMLIDFGAARAALGEHSKSLSVLVTQGYAPVEQYSSHSNQGPWTDVYALGATMHRCISGDVPMDSSARLTAVIGDGPDPLPPALKLGKGRYSKTLLEAIDWSLQVRAQDRPQSVQEFQDAITGGMAVPALSNVFKPKTGKRRARPAAQFALQVPKGLFIGVAVTLILLLAGVAGMWGYNQWSEHRRQKDAELFARASSLATPEAYLEYAENCATCSQADEARAAADRLRQSADQALFDEAVTAGTSAAYDQYLKGCSLCTHKQEATEKHALLLAQEQKDAEAITRVKGVGSARNLVLDLSGYMPGSCSAQLRKELGEYGRRAVQMTDDYDAILSVTISTPRFFQGYWAAGWRTNYSAKLFRRGDRKLLWSGGAEEDGTSQVDACEDAVEEIAERLFDN